MKLTDKWLKAHRLEQSLPETSGLRHGTIQKKPVPYGLSSNLTVMCLSRQRLLIISLWWMSIVRGTSRLIFTQDVIHVQGHGASENEKVFHHWLWLLKKPLWWKKKKFDCWTRVRCYGVRGLRQIHWRPCPHNVLKSIASFSRISFVQRWLNVSSVTARFIPFPLHQCGWQQWIHERNCAPPLVRILQTRPSRPATGLRRATGSLP